MTLPGWMADQLRGVNTLFGTDTVIVTPTASLNAYAERVPGTPVSYDEARVEGKIQQIRTATGQERTSVQTVDFNGEVAVSPDDTITLPDATEQLVLAVVSIRLGAEIVTTRAFL